MSVPSPHTTWSDRLVVWIAQGFGSGLLPAGPGTWGSLVGILWLWALLLPGSALLFGVLVAGSILLAVGGCARAEKVLRQHDPGSVVLDEIVAVPLTFFGPWLVLGTFPAASWSDPLTVAAQFWPEFLVGFIAFRVFDIAKPGPIGRIQSLPDGWGVVADDVLAGLAAAVVTGLFTYLRHWVSLPG
ncbi:MAG: phosphatidylglycerophosphatase A [Verrucomicrobia bacterium]|nr:phosphatidylglycerophosphatase A [Verrucomicrobiota bacterium]